MLKALLGKLFHREPGKEPGHHPDNEVVTMAAKRTPTGKDSKKAAAPAKAADKKKTAPAPQKSSAKTPVKNPPKKAAAPAKVADKKKPAPAPVKAAAPAPKAKAAAPAASKPTAPKIAPKTAPGKKTSGKSGLAGGISPYQAKKGENYMNEPQKAHFRSLLLAWKSDLMEEVDRTVTHMKDEAANFPDPADRATQEEEFSLELRARDRERKLIKKIDSTLELIDQDDYGYCEACGIEIGVERLEVRPTATLCIDCKTLAEIKERQLGA